MADPEYMKETNNTVRQATTGERLLLLIVAALIIAADQVSKQLVEANLPLNTYWTPIIYLTPYFQISHVANTGTAFGLFPNGGSIFSWTAVIVGAGILIFNYNLQGGSRLFRLALGLQLGGALGNFIDRLRLGHVTDFLDFGSLPVFNLADAALISGALLLLLVLWREEKERARRQFA